MEHDLVFVHSRIDLERDKSKFEQVRQFGASFLKIQNVKKSERSGR